MQPRHTAASLALLLASRARPLHYQTIVHRSTTDLSLPRTSPAPSGTGARERVRPFCREDIPDVVALRRRAFHHSERASDAALAAHFESVFFGWPWADDALPSLVCENARGQLAGFLGVLPRPMRLRDASLRAAVTTQFMTTPEADPLVAVRLARALLSGPQDLTLADTANDAVQRMWSLSGGGTAWAYSLTWVKPLRPTRYAATRWRRGTLPWAALLAARPLLRVVDAAAAGRRRPDGAIEQLSAAALVAGLGAVAPRRWLRPRYEPASLEWLLQRAAEKRSLGTLQRVRVLDGMGQPAGWFLYYLNRNGVSQVMQIAARRDAVAVVLEHLWHHAWTRGAVALEGRVDPALLPALSAQGCRLARQGPWMLCHSPHPEVELAIHQGDAFLSRLEGEWWLSF